MDFRQFIESSEKYESDVKETIKKLPDSFQKMLRPYKIKFQGGNSLKGDGGHIGFIDEEKLVITIAAPWNYGREYTFLHEVGHMVWKYFVPEEMKKEWPKIVKATKHKQDQNDEELFCMAFADAYAKNKIEIHHHDEWLAFINKIPTKIQTPCH